MSSFQRALDKKITKVVKVTAQGNEMIPTGTMRSEHAEGTVFFCF